MKVEEREKAEAIIAAADQVLEENYYRKWCRDFATFCGMTPDEMHDELLCQTFGSGVRRRPVKRSSKAARTDYSELVETLCRVAAETGYYIPPPHEDRE